MAAAALAFLGTGTAATATTAATAGLFGTGGVFSLGATLSTLGTGFSVLGTLGSGIAQSNAAEFNAKIAEQNAMLSMADAERQAYYIKKNADDEAAQLREKNQRAQASRAAIIGASGFDMQGSPLQVMEGADYLGELDVQKILAGGQVAADNALLRGSRASAAQLAQAELDSGRAVSALTGGYIGAGSTLLKYGAKRSGYGYSMSDALI